MFIINKGKIIFPEEKKSEVLSDQNISAQNKQENKAVRKPRSAAEQRANLERIVGKYGYIGKGSLNGIYF